MDVGSAPPTADEPPSDASTGTSAASEVQATSACAEATPVIQITRAATADAAPEDPTPSAVVNAVAPTEPKQRRTSCASDPRADRRWHGAEMSVDEDDGGASGPWTPRVPLGRRRLCRRI